jgi:hypothetical protein
MAFRLVALTLLWGFLTVAKWYEAIQSGNMGSFVMFLILFGACLILYYLEWKSKTGVFEGVDCHTPDTDH